MFYIFGGTIFFGGKPLKIYPYEYLQRYQALKKEIHKCFSFQELCEIENSIIFRIRDPFGNSHHIRVEHIVNDVCRELEKRLQQNEVSSSRFSTSNLCEESDLDNVESTIKDPLL